MKELALLTSFQGRVFMTEEQLMQSCWGRTVWQSFDCPTTVGSYGQFCLVGFSRYLSFIELQLMQRTMYPFNVCNSAGFSIFIEVCNSMGFSIFIELCNYHHVQFQKISSSSKEAPYSLAVTLLPLALSATGNHKSIFCLYEFTYPEHFL